MVNKLSLSYQIQSNEHAPTISKKLENSSMKRSNISIVLTVGCKTRRQAIGISRKVLMKQYLVHSNNLPHMIS